MNKEKILSILEIVEAIEKPAKEQSKSSLADKLIGEFVIIRSRNEGINAGMLEQADDTGVILSNCRRLYYHEPKDKSLSWYEGVAVSGLGQNSRISGTVEKKIIIENYSITQCTKEAKKSIMEHTPNAQN